MSYSWCFNNRSLLSTPLLILADHLKAALSTPLLWHISAKNNVAHQDYDPVWVDTALPQRHQPLGQLLPRGRLVSVDFLFEENVKILMLNKTFKVTFNIQHLTS